ncbi:Spore coat polysaccharide biosynthesis protein spsA [Escherichia coli]|uniref:Spore coat polysaccharide biosynthesis protein spsA n=28 Tax=Escherichia coli TaxID=562 RepID=A0A377BNU6_ECOLX|nr:Spore coat polysaccharide biosynthesis protein spsA [Escherichia coli]
MAENDHSTFLSILGLYIYSPIIALGQLNEVNSSHFGVYTFRFIYAITNKIGLIKELPVNTILDYSYVPVPTNVYTVLQPFYQDFGYTGIIFGAVLYGLVYVSLYTAGVRGNNTQALLIYALFSVSSATAFFAENASNEFSWKCEVSIMYHLTMAIYSNMQTSTVTILMATYNGEAFIKNQILSLQQQTFSNWRLFIQDDGSTDNTISIIKNFQKSDSRIRLVDDNLKGQGAGKNFLSLIKYSETDYTIYCDQDDIWLENKIFELVKYANEIKLNVSDAPSLVYADGYAYMDGEGTIDFSGISNNHADQLKDFLFFNGGYQGCSIMFNRAMTKFLLNYRGFVYLHDDITTLAAYALGKVYFLPKYLMLYRQHTNAVTGIKTFRNGLTSKFKSPVNYLLSRKHYQVKKSFFECNSSILSETNKKVFLDFISFCESNNKFTDFFKLWRGGFRLNNSRTKLLLKFLIRRKFSE